MWQNQYFYSQWQSNGPNYLGLIQTNDNNYVISDNTNTSVAVFKTDQNGNIMWTKNYPSIGAINSSRTN